MLGRFSLVSLLLASLVISSDASARGSRHDAAVAGALVGAVIGGVIVANSRYERAPVYVEIGPPPPRVIYYEPYRGYYSPPRAYYHAYPRVVEPGHGYKPRFHKHHHRHHHKHHHRRHHRHGGYYGSRW
ncbi:hypothetical protein [Pseudomonas benzenivorans]|uniref:PXPV repeat-containing protein n=1 Tax=Pseudomonas benzenivorans TaxID=556533 RepID=A0ABY5HCK8_9PSED|nr:hypothetical protein [Pseudomonas benzenivorans]UTW09333.1 hypothetical protein KDW96_08555 [Pseudomonas benzenivorans]